MNRYQKDKERNPNFLQEARERNRKHYYRRLKDKGTCADCGGPCGRRYTRCATCNYERQGRRLGKLSQEKSIA